MNRHKIKYWLIDLIAVYFIERTFYFIERIDCLLHWQIDCLHHWQDRLFISLKGLIVYFIKRLDCLLNWEDWLFALMRGLIFLLHWEDCLLHWQDCLLISLTGLIVYIIDRIDCLCHWQDWLFTSLRGLTVYFIDCSASVVGLAVHVIARIAIYPLHYFIDWIASFDGTVYYSH